MPWMEEIRRHLNEKVNQVNEFNITFEKVKKEVAKRKEKRIDSTWHTQNKELLVEKARTSPKGLTRAFTKIKEDNTNIPA